MIKLDHFVIHTDVSQLAKLKQTCDDFSIPFEPTWGKGTRGFKVANLWFGDEYLELVWLKRPDGGGWRPEWVEQYNQGHRGLTAIMLLTDDLSALQRQLESHGFTFTEPERISFRWLVFKKTLPWRTLYLPPIPGTDIQLTFSQHDHPKVMETFRPHMVPNAREVGVKGLEQVLVKCAFSAAARDYLTRVFPHSWQQGCLPVNLDSGHTLSFETAAKPEVEIRAPDAQARGAVLKIENVSLKTVPLGAGS